jgi:hypothetical protein
VTVLTCPAWCTALHEDPGPPDDLLTHHHEIGTVVPVDSTGQIRVVVAATDDITSSTRGPVEIGVWGPADTLTPGQARRLAGLLFEATDFAEREGGAS